MLTRDPSLLSVVVGLGTELESLVNLVRHRYTEAPTGGTTDPYTVVALGDDTNSSDSERSATPDDFAQLHL